MINTTSIHSCGNVFSLEYEQDFQSVTCVALAQQWLISFALFKVAKVHSCHFCGVSDDESERLRPIKLLLLQGKFRLQQQMMASPIELSVTTC